MINQTYFQIINILSAAFAIELYLGESNSPLSFFLDLTLDKTWLLASYSINEIDDYSSENELIIIKTMNQSYTSKVIKNKIKFDDNNDLSIVNFPLHILQNDTGLILNNVGGLGLSFAFHDKNKSIIHALHCKGMINHASFAFNHKNHTFIIGDIPNNEVSNRNYSFCNVLGRDGEWNCRISQVVIIRNNYKELIYKNKRSASYAYFSVDKVSYAPKKFIDMLIKIYFKEKIANGECRLAELDYRCLYCDINEDILNKNITFYIGDYAYPIQFEIFWEAKFNYIRLDLFDNPFGDYWILGQGFYYKYIIQFDYERELIEFYSMKEDGVVRNYLKYDLLYSINVLLGINLFILSIGLVLLWISNRSKSIKIKSSNNMHNEYS